MAWSKRYFDYDKTVKRRKKKVPIETLLFDLKKKFIAGATVAVLLIGSVFSFAGCQPADEQPPVTHEPPVSDVTPQPPIVDNNQHEEIVNPPVIEEKATIDDLIENYRNLAGEFAGNEFDAILVATRTRLGYAFEVNDEGQITAVLANSMDFGDNNKRTILAEKIAFESPVEVDDIISGKYNTQRIGGAYSQEQAITFDARENYLNQKLCTSLMEVCNVSGGQNFFAEIENTDNYTKYQLSNTNILTNKTEVYEITLPKDSSVSPASVSAQNDVKLVSVLEFGDYQIDYLDYKVEEFQPETVEELLTYYSEEIQTALQENFYAGITKKMFGRNFDETKLVDPEWRIVHEDNKITGFQFVTKYESSPGAMQFRLGNITFAQPLDLSSLSSGLNQSFASQVNDATYSQDMTFGYATAEQGQHDDLVSAIFEAKGMGYDAPAGATRYFVNQGACLDENLGETNKINVLQIEKGKVTAFTIYIKNSNGTYAEMLESLKDKTKFEILAEQVCEISETSIELPITETEPELTL